MKFNQVFHPARFNRALLQARHQEFLTIYSEDELLKHNMYLSDDEQSGFWISEQGEIGNLFSLNHHGADAIYAAQDVAGVWLQCFQGFLSEFYHKHGFRITSRIPWDEAFAPPEWDYTKNGTPNVVNMHLCY
jgi:hypothetical protein